jgi:flagellar protein FlaG
MTGTFSSSTHESDVRIRTDFKIIATYANASSGIAQIWMKNIGSERIGWADIRQSDVFCGAVGSFDHLTYHHVDPGNLATLEPGQWTEEFGTGYDLNENSFWDPGETLMVTSIPRNQIHSGSNVYFQFALPNGIWRSTEFTVS